MSRITISIPDDLDDHIRRAAGGNVSAWLTKLARDEVMRTAAQGIAAYEAQHYDAQYELARLNGEL